MGAEQAEYVDCEFGLPEGSIEVGPRGEDIQLLFVHLMSEGFVEGIHLRQNFRLPQAFWKIVAARRPDGTLAVAAFHFDQAALLARHDAAAPRPGDFRSTVAQVEALTGLDFGSLLRDAPPLDLDDA